VTAREIDSKIFSLRKAVALQLVANNPEEANRLLDRIRELEQEKQNLRKPGGSA
jgi:hypothetical protein